MKISIGGQEMSGARQKVVCPNCGETVTVSIKLAVNLRRAPEDGSFIAGSSDGECPKCGYKIPKGIRLTLVGKDQYFDQMVGGAIGS